MEIEQLNEMSNQLKLLLIGFIREIVGYGSTVFFNENSYQISDCSGKIYQLIELRAENDKIEIDIRYVNKKKIHTINILNLTNNEIFLICKMLNFFKFSNENEANTDNQ